MLVEWTMDENEPAVHLPSGIITLWVNGEAKLMVGAIQPPTIHGPLGVILSLSGPPFSNGFLSCSVWAPHPFEKGDSFLGYPPFKGEIQSEDLAVSRTPSATVMVKRSDAMRLFRCRPKSVIEEHIETRGVTAVIRNVSGLDGVLVLYVRSGDHPRMDLFHWEYGDYDLLESGGDLLKMIGAF